MSLIITQGYGNNNLIVTFGYGMSEVAVEEYNAIIRMLEGKIWIHNIYDGEEVEPYTTRDIYSVKIERETVKEQFDVITQLLQGNIEVQNIESDDIESNILKYIYHAKIEKE